MRAMISLFRADDFAVRLHGFRIDERHHAAEIRADALDQLRALPAASSLNHGRPALCSSIHFFA